MYKRMSAFFGGRTTETVEADSDVLDALVVADEAVNDAVNDADEEADEEADEGVDELYKDEVRIRAIFVINNTNQEWMDKKHKAEGLLAIMDPSTPIVKRYNVMLELYHKMIDHYYNYKVEIEPKKYERDEMGSMRAEVEQIHSDIIESFLDICAQMKELFDEVI